MYRLSGRIQQYAWGGNNFIPDLFHLEVDRSIPSAEYWLGVHPGGDTLVELPTGQSIRLSELIDGSKEKYLGKETAVQFGQLPFLLKVLDVRDMLSIQVHPNKKDAEVGFEEENNKGIPLNAPNRNYKDNNHKPEIMIALSEFWLLHGFAENIAERLEQYSFLHEFRSFYERGGIKELYKTLMELSEEETHRILKPLSDTLLPLYHEGKLEKSSPDFWAARAFDNLCKDNKFDKGIFSIYLFNILQLLPGEGIFQGAGMPHAYLEGQNIELMSNSDNVLRAGLTPKYIDIPELLKNTLFNPTTPNIIRVKQEETIQQYDCPVPDFKITAYNLKDTGRQTLVFEKPAILLFISGNANLHVEDRTIAARSAVAYFCTPCEKVDISAISDLYFVVASTP
ncbi:MAG: mannose-6-phosphate isomerase, class I [Chitinophagia bacterium]|nr:mannose-6-phosphate isomerase, class I [Chitinophagia bacterium]